MGAAFPLSLKVWVGRHGMNGATGREVGTFYAINMAGAVLGAIAGGFILLPRLGSRMSLILLGGAMLASAGLVVTVIEPARRRLPIVAASLLTTIFALSSVRLPDPIATAIAGRYPGERMLWHEEGIQTTASVHQRGLGRFLYIDGLAQADDAPSTTKAHWRIGHPRDQRAISCDRHRERQPESEDTHIAQHRLCDYLGQISYGIYVLHVPCLVLIAYLMHDRFGIVLSPNPAGYAVAYAIGTGGTLLATASYRWFERPFLEWKSAFSRIETAAVARRTIGTLAGGRPT